MRTSIDAQLIKWLVYTVGAAFAAGGALLAQRDEVWEASLCFFCSMVTMRGMWHAR